MVVKEIFQNIGHPRLLCQMMNISYYSLKKRLGQLPEGIDVMEEDWDNLIILDACRYDAFVTAWANRETLDGELKQVRSKAPFTNEFLRENVHQRDLTDTVYVTSSPHLHKTNDGVYQPIEANFAAVDHVWKHEDRFDPGLLVDRTKKALEKHPNKRIIAHMIPPHQPYFGESADELEEILTSYEIENWKGMVANEIPVDDELIWRAYAENIAVAMRHTEDLVDALDGKTVVTADHGQLLGDREFPLPIKGYGHPSLFVDELLNVPWLECSYNKRRTITDQGESATEEGEAEAKAKEALRELGYL